MARRKAKTVEEMIEGFKDQQEAPHTAQSMETVMLVKKTFLYGAVAHAGASVSVPTTIANVLRAKGIIK
jgi:hypothetical protein